jgi:hypothetical protein
MANERRNSHHNSCTAASQEHLLHAQYQPVISCSSLSIPAAAQADNDLALGRIVQAITNSPDLGYFGDLLGRLANDGVNPHSRSSD